ncbi:hypothetical protein B0H17DRAFT_19912 [Mycena rosella]|uniref:Uncharacterized protein n=1 Tax=Mycena rosella TaxID=1033263 RepID=A0AAD7B3X3_MYCRO|nr:hypothetical protein B0H17DRAFT_19912 [Mycena rosella]
MIDNHFTRREPDPRYFKTSPNMMSLIWLQAARYYVDSVAGNYPYQGECTLWIRPSTGGLCLDLTRDDFDFDLNPEPGFGEFRHSATGDRLLEPNQHSDILADISIREYHEICHKSLSKHLELSISPHTSLKLGTVYRFLGANYDSPVEVAFVECTDLGWENLNVTVPGQIMGDGWICIPSAEVQHKYPYSIDAGNAGEWLSQANHIFKCLDITSNYEDYAVVESALYQLTLYGPTDGLPPGYLFICPLKDLNPDDPSCFRYPDCPAYWSLDPTGVERLSTEEATDLGFPSFEFEAAAQGYSWDSSVYEGLRQFHEAKEFDPYSQDVAQHLGCPLYQLSAGLEASSAHRELHRTPGLITLTELNSGRDQ